MNLKAIKKLLAPSFKLRRGKKRGGMDEYEFNYANPTDVKRDIQEKYGHNSDLLEIFTSNKDSIVHKWHHYIPLYDRYFSSFRGKKIRFLEIGVSKGGSLQMWRKYFGEQAVIYGIDINPECEKYNGVAGQVRIGSQVDEEFLESVIEEMGGVDVILDDGSHHMDHISVTLKSLFQHLNYGGIYMIEDLHTAYWKSFGGGYQSNKNFFGFLMELVDDMHSWYHAEELMHETVSKDCPSIHIHDSIVVLEKEKVYEPAHSKIG